MKRKKVVIIGGGMAGLSAAWRLSEPGWRDRFESITVYQRGWRLGGKAASSRGLNGRIEEHGLHIWLGYYENAFAMLRECYEELDRHNSDPDAPVKSWNQALSPADRVGVADRFSDDWQIWLGAFTRNSEIPGDPSGSGRELTSVEFVVRAINLVLDFVDSMRETVDSRLVLSASSDKPEPKSISAVKRGLRTALLALTGDHPNAATALDSALLAIREDLDYEARPEHRRSWLLLSLVLCIIRGIVAENLMTDPRGLRALNGEDFINWIMRHGAHRDLADYPVVRGLYDLVFGYENANPDKPAFAAGWGVFLTGLIFFGYKGAIFWKMTAGMGDVVIAPLYQALRSRGVRFEFFHRLDALHLDSRHQAIDSITLGRQVRLAVEEYEPLTRVKDLPVFPKEPLTEQLLPGQEPADGWHALETYWSIPNDAETCVLRRGVDYDRVVLAVSVGMMPVVARELIDDRREWRDMIAHVQTVATHSFQLWLRPDEPTLGWKEPGVTISAYLHPFETWASMPQTLWAEDWPKAEQPHTIAYYCGAMQAPWPTTEVGHDYARRHQNAGYQEATAYVEQNLGRYFPAAYNEHGFNWRLLCGANGKGDVGALATQHVSVNIDPSDRYVQSIPGTDRYRLRPDESGYDDLILAGDWTDCGLNAGCIEAAVVSGFEAANVVLGRGRRYRIRGFCLT